MKDTDYAYCVSLIKEKENSLLKNEFFWELCDNPNFKSVCDLIREKGYFTDNPLKSIEKVWFFIKNIIPYKDELDFLIVKNDFQNLKAIIKATIFKKTDEFIFTSPAIIEEDFLLKTISERDFSLLPSWISDTALKGYELFSQTLNSMLFEMFIDFHTIKAIKEFSRKTNNAFSKFFCDEISNVTSLKTALRIATMTDNDKNKINFEYAFLESEKLDIEKLKKCSLSGVEETIEYIRKTDYNFFSEEFLKEKKLSDKFIDEYIFSLFEDTKIISFGIEPVIRYYIYNEMTAKNISAILNFKKANKDASFIKERLRKLYV